MSKALILYNPHSDSAQFTGGSWTSGLPLANLANQKLHRVARSTDLQLANTQFKVALPGEKTFKAIAVGPMNVTPTYRYRLRSYSDDAFSVLDYDSDWVQPFVGSNSQDEWEDAWFWLGVEPFDDADRNPWLFHIFDTLTSGQYWKLEIDNTENPAGYVEIGRLFMPDFVDPSHNYAVGNNGLQFLNNSLTQNTLSGAEQTRSRVNPRQWSCAFDMLADAEMYEVFYRLFQHSAYRNETLVIPDPSDAEHIQKRAIFGKLTQTDPLAQAQAGYGGTGFTITETI